MPRKIPFDHAPPRMIASEWVVAYFHPESRKRLSSLPRGQRYISAWTIGSQIAVNLKHQSDPMEPHLRVRMFTLFRTRNHSPFDDKWAVGHIPPSAPTPVSPPTTLLYLAAILPLRGIPGNLPPRHSVARQNYRYGARAQGALIFPIPKEFFLLVTTYTT